jgi:hypothetical protein
MSVDQAIRSMIRDEVEAAVLPLQRALADLQNSGLGKLSQLLGGGAVKRGPGRPPNPFKLATVGARRGPGRPPGSGAKAGRSRADNGANDRGCALQGCKRPARSKGFCAAHYQKYRNLEATGRLPSDWKPFASPGSVKDIILPRGRAGSKALAATRRK